MASNRYTTEQFGRGITVDGSRIDRAVRDLVNRMNSLDPMMVQRRWVPTTMALGYSPWILPAAPVKFPWLWADNDTGMSGISTPTVVTNKWRTKSCYINGIDPSDPVGGNLWTWATTLYVSKPTILSSVNVWLVTDSVYTNDFTNKNPNPPPGFIANSPSEDLTVQVTIDSNLDPEDRKKTSVEAIQYRFDTSRSKISFQSIDPAWDDLLPPHPEGPVSTGLCVEIPVICLLPENSRIRLEITIPEYFGYDSGWSQYPWQTQVWSANVQLLEACEE